jgi:hypothetical protein
MILKIKIMNEINEIKLPKGVDRISVKQHEDKIVIEFIPEKSKFKEGDFVYKDGRIMIVKSYPNMYHANTYPEHSNFVYYNDWYGVDFSSPTFRHATEDEKQLLIDAMRKYGKRWNADKKCIEDIPKRKFKNGDKVRIKDGISSKTHNRVGPKFVSTMDEFIGKKLMVKGYSNDGYVLFNEDYLGYLFAEDWLEPWSDELKKGDLAIFWDNESLRPLIRLYHAKQHNENRHCDNFGGTWENAVKFESKEQFEKIIDMK